MIVAIQPRDRTLPIANLFRIFDLIDQPREPQKKSYCASTAPDLKLLQQHTLHACLGTSGIKKAESSRTQPVWILLKIENFLIPASAAQNWSRESTVVCKGRSFSVGFNEKRQEREEGGFATCQPQTDADCRSCASTL